VTTFPARPTIPARPAAYIRDADAATPDDPDMTAQRNMVISLAQDLGWPVPAVYADAGQADQPGSQLAALVEAITAGRHDGVFATHPAQISHHLAQIEAFDRLCRPHKRACEGSDCAGLRSGLRERRRVRLLGVLS